MSGIFTLESAYEPAGDQPKAINELMEGLGKGLRHQILFGVTGSGKTFTMANVIAQYEKPTLIIAHNKTLAAQLAQEYRTFFPKHAVCYFVSYYDYYQPEAYMPITDTYIEKEAEINEEIDRLRHAATQALLTRPDVIVVASVSAIYGLGSPIEYEKVHLHITKNGQLTRASLIRKLVDIHFSRTTADLTPGTFRARGNIIEIMPVNEKVIYRILFSKDIVGTIEQIDAITRTILSEQDSFFLFPAKHFITPLSERKRAIRDIQVECKEQEKKLKASGRLLEAERLTRRTMYDIAMIREIGYVSGIENYSRHFDGRKVGEPPYTLLSYFPHTDDGKPDFLTIIDESHVTVPQLKGMYAGDQSRKRTLIEHGFRLPSAADNRPLEFEEFEERIGQVIYTSATPGPHERSRTERIVEQVVRPTGLIDPMITVKGVVEKDTYKGQIADVIEETMKTVAGGERAIVTTLTKKMAEDLAEYLREKNIKAEYLHSDVTTIDRITILTDFRKGVFDCLVGVNLLREGLDLPEVSFIGILDADKEGFLRSETALIQIIGRAARNVRGHVTLYADSMTDAMEQAIQETNRRRQLQLAYNTEHNITPKTIEKNIRDITDELTSEHTRAVTTLMGIDRDLYARNPKKVLAEKKKQMTDAVKILDFETAAILRDEITALTEGRALKKNMSKRKKSRYRPRT